MVQPIDFVVYLTKDVYCTKLGEIYRTTSNYYRTHKNRLIVVPKKAKKLGGKSLTPKGYLRIRLEDKTSFVHTHIAYAFLGPKPAELQVNHKNGIKTDNRAINLEYVTNYENRQHAVKNNLIAKGEKIGKLTENQVRKIRKYYKQGKTQSFIAKKFRVVQQTISSVVKQHTWKHVL